MWLSFLQNHQTCLSCRESSFQLFSGIWRHLVETKRNCMKQWFPDADNYKLMSHSSMFSQSWSKDNFKIEYFDIKIVKNDHVDKQYSSIFLCCGM